MLTTPDFTDHEWTPIRSASRAGSVVSLAWDGDVRLDAFGPWLYEQSAGIDPVTREGLVEPSDLPPDDCVRGVSLDPEGALVVAWFDGSTTRLHPGWLRSIARDEHLPRHAVGDPTPWTAAEFCEPPTFDGSDVLGDDVVLERWLSTLATTGVARLRGVPATDDFMSDLASRIGPVRGSNFGGIFTVESVVAADSTANTARALGQHTDLPTRETPPGYQFLHCVENSVSGGASRLADGLAVIAELERNHPDAHHSLTTDEWVFANRARDGDHRWIGPIIDRTGPRAPVTLRAFYPVRLAPRMPVTEQPRAYDALRIFSRVAHDPRFMINYPFEPGDVVGFDNRRILHGRDAFDPTAGRRRLRGCYIDHDDVFSRLRVLRRARGGATSSHERKGQP